MITITSVSAGLDASEIPADLTLSSVEAYPGGYQRIVDAIYAGQSLRVLVTDRSVARWLETLSQRYGPERVAYRPVTVRSLLEERVGLTVPAEIGEREIQDAGLLELNIPASGQGSFQDYLLEVFFGSFMIRTGTVYRVNEIIAAYEPEQWQSALARPLVKKIYVDWFRRQRAAMEKGDQQAELLLLEWLEKSPEVYIRNLSALRLLANYPAALGERVFGAAYRDLSRLGLDLRRVPVVIQGNEAVIDEIRLCLTQLSGAAKSEALSALLEEASGLLDIEVDAAVTLLRSGEVPVTQQIVQRIQRKFAPLQDEPHIAQDLEDLNLLVPVPEPSAPESTWNADEWMRWAAEEYLPYRFWLENTGSLNDEIGDLAGKFADWLYANYGSLRYNSPHMAWRAALSLAEKMKSHAGPVLVVMVDNLNAKFYPALQRHLQLQGFYEQDFRYCFSMLPTFTEVSKKCIILGDYKPFVGEQGYASVVQGDWGKRLGKKVRYLANIVELRKVTERAHDVYFLNYLPVDMILHQQDSHTGISHAQAVQGYLATLARDIHAFARRLGAERDLMVIILSDHGSTRIPRGAINVIDHNLYRKHALDEHHRFISITEEEAAKLPEKVQYECYLFNAKEFDLPENYLVAKRLYRFRPTDDSVYIHGGLTPEEVIIPVAVFQPAAVTPRPLSVHLIEPKKVIAGTRPELVFEITNHNNYPAEQLEIEVIDPNIEAAQITLDGIQKLQRETFRLKARCLNNADISLKKLRMRVVYRFLGQVQEQVAEVPVTYDTLVKTKFDFDDL